MLSIICPILYGMRCTVQSIKYIFDTANENLDMFLWCWIWCHWAEIGLTEIYVQIFFFILIDLLLESFEEHHTWERSHKKLEKTICNRQTYDNILNTIFIHHTIHQNPLSVNKNTKINWNTKKNSEYINGFSPKAIYKYM